nr:metalloprotease PmbA [Parachitinimonas caeni]
MTTTQFAYSSEQLQMLAADALRMAADAGATSCNIEVSEGFGQNVSVRVGAVETIEYNRDKGIGITVYLGQAKGHSSTSDFSPTAIRQAVEAAVAIARYTAADDCAGLPDREQLATVFPELDLYHPWDLSVERAIELALSCEAAARNIDPRITNSDGAGVSSHATHFVYANSLGFSGYSVSSRHSMSCSVIAEENDTMQRDYWYTTARAAEDLESAIAVGEHAGRRTLARLGARRIKTAQVPVLFDPSQAAGLFGHLVSAVSGGSLYRRSSFLLDSLGKPVMAPCVNVHETPFLPRGLASSPFDGEGVAVHERDLVENGVLNGYFLSSYTARKLGMTTTGNAGGCHNLLIKPTITGGQAELIKTMGRGLLVTELLGHGINMVTGDYSHGAAGFWVENGEIVHPVEEVTIAGNLKDMFMGIQAIGSDLETRGSKRVGSVLIDRMMVAGE